MGYKLYLQGKTIPARSFTHYLGSLDLPAKIPAEQLVKLVYRLRMGDKTVVNTIVEGHITLAMQIVGRYLTCLGSKRLANDLVGVAMLAIIEATNDATITMHDNNITPYIIRRIHSRLSAHITEDHVVVIPDKSARRLRLNAPKCSDVVSYPICEKSHVASITLRDTLAYICRTTAERKILDLRSKGWSNSDIAEVVGMSTSVVQRVIAELRARYDELEA